MSQNGEIERTDDWSSSQMHEEAGRQATIAENLVLTLAKLNMVGHGVVAAASFAAYSESSDIDIKFAAANGLLIAAIGGGLAIFAAVKITVVLERTSQKLYKIAKDTEKLSVKKSAHDEIHNLIRQRKSYSNLLYFSGILLVAPVLVAALVLINKVYPYAVGATT